ncbi:Pfs77 [Plasmodium vivax India VII]|uniref:Pfs77 n=3 Tax=Plasmodium vivax TaxID=5855 RepID=A0A0J9TBQ6_PLAVI|nr:Pfs77 [Plasmodium vivax India VII]KMZ92112.1 Pfs77 [Plasmodium vivax Mauritania I]SCO68182.1 inner membrane complex protein 1j, putative [Plasmodium vivax]
MERKQCALFFRDCCKERNDSPPKSNHQASEHDEMYYEGETQQVYEQVEERPVINVKGDQPVFNIPVYQDKYIRDKIIETKKYEVQDVLQPKHYTQETKHDVPTVELLFKERKVNISQEKMKEKTVEVDMPIGYTPVFSPIWDVREIPRVIPKYEGEQKVIQVEVPQIKYIDKFVEKEIIVDVKEKIIPKITQVEKQIDIVKYEWKEKYQDVPVCKYVPKIDIELDCPPPLIVPYPEVHFQNMSEVVNPNQRAADIPPEILLRNSSFFKEGRENVEGDEKGDERKHGYNFLGDHTFQHRGEYQGGPHASASNTHVDALVKKSLLDVARLNSQNGKGETQRRGSQPLTPMELKKKKKNNQWPFCNFTNCNQVEEKKHLEDCDPKTGYPLSMPKDFAAFFKKDLNTVKKQMGQHTDSKSTQSSNLMEKSPVNPTIEYLGKIDKPPIDGGKLDPISFKLHAIEVHQFIPVPSLAKPQFLDLVPPEQVQNNDISSLQNVFGQVPEGWVDPNITGFIAPMMYDVLQGNVQPQSPLFNKLSMVKDERGVSYPSVRAARERESTAGSYHRGMSVQRGDHYEQMHMANTHGSTNSFVHYNTSSSLNYTNENDESYETVMN